MFCSNCGTMLDDNATICPNCQRQVKNKSTQPDEKSTSVVNETTTTETAFVQTAYRQPDTTQSAQAVEQTVYQQPVNPLTPEQNEAIKAPYIMCILAIVFRGVVGIVLSCLAKTKLNEYKAKGYPVIGKAQSTENMAKISFILSIVFAGTRTLMYIILFFVAIFQN